jgi:hypothetical protein
MPMKEGLRTTASAELVDEGGLSLMVPEYYSSI